jgi:hypothetical protein
MGKLITLVDDTRPDEPLEAEVEHFDDSLLRVAVPNTHVRFELRRLNAETMFEGELGGRHFSFDPNSSPTVVESLSVNPIEDWVRSDLI